MPNPGATNDLRRIRELLDATFLLALATVLLRRQRQEGLDSAVVTHSVVAIVAILVEVGVWTEFNVGHGFIDEADFRAVGQNPNDPLTFIDLQSRVTEALKDDLLGCPNANDDSGFKLQELGGAEIIQVVIVEIGLVKVFRLPIVLKAQRRLNALTACGDHEGQTEVEQHCLLNCLEVKLQFEHLLSRSPSLRLMIPRNRQDRKILFLLPARSIGLLGNVAFRSRVSLNDAFFGSPLVY